MNRPTEEEKIGKGRPVTVIGAGFSGLAAAHHLERAGFKVVVRERERNVGGLLQTLRKENGLVETAANGILNSVLVEDLFEAAGVTMLPTLRPARARFIFRDGRARRFPLQGFEIIHLTRFFAQFILRKSRLAPFPQETLSHWGARVLSKSTARYSIETAFQGIYAGDPDELSATLLLGSIFQRKPNGRGKVKKGFRGTVAPLGGMGELVHSLKRHLEARGVEFKLCDQVSANELIQSDGPFVIATDMTSAANLLEGVDRERAEVLRKIETLPLVTTTAYFAKNSMPLRGFGCLFPPGEAGTLGVLFNHNIFSERSPKHDSETWILGGAFFKKEHGDVATFSDRELIEIIVSERAKLLGRSVSPQPESFHITRWPKALPHFTIELEKALPDIHRHQGKFYLLGNFTGGIGLSKILEQAAGLPAKIADTGQWSVSQQQVNS